MVPRFETLRRHRRARHLPPREPQPHTHGRAQTFSGESQLAALLVRPLPRRQTDGRPARREMNFELPKLYPITDRRLSGLTHAEQVARLCEGGARLLQLREKHLPAREFHAEVLEALRVARL